MDNGSKTRGECKLLIGDFETSVYEGQKTTEVWAAACVELFTEKVQIFNSLPALFLYLQWLDIDVDIWFHNLKFDGTFWLDYFLRCKSFKTALIHNEDYTECKWKDEESMENGEFKYMISDRGQWYSIIIKINNHYIRILDSLKLLPFSVKKIGESFGTKHKKLEIEYKGERHAGGTITEEEKRYIANDVLVVKEAMEIMREQGHNKLTIGSCCLQEYKVIMGYMFDNYFPDLTTFKLDEEQYGSSNADEYIRHSYKGGWCYVARGKENRVFTNGITADVNSLYPSMMSSESGNFYPVGKPHFWKGNHLPIQVSENLEDCYYFVRVRTQFYLKPYKLPSIQIKGNPLYMGTEWLFTSDIYDTKEHKYCSKIVEKDGTLSDAIVELTLTKTDFILLRENYTLKNFEILDGCWFTAAKGIFDDYINKYKKIKMESKGAIRELAKLFLNNLYGKLATSPDSSYKIAYLNEDDCLAFITHLERQKDTVFIAVGSAITSYARNFTIRTAMKNYHVRTARGFIYADTDSIHCDLTPEELVDVPVSHNDFCCWKLEASWDRAIFARQKTYIEHVVAENLTPIETPYYNIKCAGMPESSKDLFLLSLMGKTEEELIDEVGEEIWNKYSSSAKEFILTKRDITDFRRGLKVEGKLVPKRIPGGTLLVETTFEMR